ncbi:hypothetical protein Tco_0018242 [Tanacetum coccineum]
MNDDTLMCERHEANYIRSEGYQNQDSHNSFSHHSYHDPNDPEKSLTELNNEMKNDLEDFKRCVLNQEPQSKTDLEKLMTKFLDDQRVSNMFVKNNINDVILKMKQIEKNFQTKFINMERKIDDWSKSQNVSSKQTDRTNPPPPPPPPPQAHTKQVNDVFTESGKSDDSPKIHKDPPPPIIVNNKIGKDKPIKKLKGNYHMVKTNEYPFREYIPKISYPQHGSFSLEPYHKES